LLKVSVQIRAGLLSPQLKALRMPGGPWTFLVLSLFIAAMVFRLVRISLPRESRDVAHEAEPSPPGLLFAVLLAFTGLMLIFSVEFVYLRDLFGNRMNTVFKFYFQAWALLGVVAAFGAYYVLEERGRSRVGRTVLGAFYALLLLGGLLYPIGMSIDRTGGFSGPATLDGIAFVARDRPEEYAAIQWLNENVPGNPVIVEAVGGSFAYEHARVSSRTGLPTVLGWKGHEEQWHALYDEIEEREQDIKTLYNGTAQDAQRIIGKYDVAYVFVGYLERAEFGNAVGKFDRFMDVAFRAGDTVIYKRRGG